MVASANDSWKGSLNRMNTLPEISGMVAYCVQCTPRIMDFAGWRKSCRNWVCPPLHLPNCWRARWNAELPGCKPRGRLMWNRVAPTFRKGNPGKWLKNSIFLCSKVNLQSLPLAVQVFTIAREASGGLSENWVPPKSQVKNSIPIKTPFFWGR